MRPKKIGSKNWVQIEIYWSALAFDCDMERVEMIVDSPPYGDENPPYGDENPPDRDESPSGGDDDSPSDCDTFSRHLFYSLAINCCKGSNVFQYFVVLVNFCMFCSHQLRQMKRTIAREAASKDHFISTT